MTTATPTDLTRDFGYRGPGSVGDTIFLDVNNNGVPDDGEGIAGVTVTLTGDLDGDGANETVSATTDTNGLYLFSGLRTTAAGVTYTVSVNSATLPAGVSQTVDPDGTLNNQSTSTLTTAAPTDLTRDFGYRGPGSIGDTIFLDVNNNGVPDTGEGIANVTVTLTGDLDGDGANETVTTTTDTNGLYLFSGLRTTTTGVTYTVAVNTATLPAGVAQTVDPDATINNQSPSTLTDAAPTDLTRDFGYRGPRSVGDTIFLDVNTNGLPDAGEGIANVTVTLTGDLDGDGTNETVTTTTDTNGNYVFSGLRTTAAGVTYTVDVNAATLPAGVSQTVDPDGTLNNQSTATLTNAAAHGPDSRLRLSRSRFDR
ncbi:MAG: SdrD B-like domain-containing protein [Gemmataceae bacterium]